MCHMHVQDSGAAQVHRMRVCLQFLVKLSIVAKAGLVRLMHGVKGATLKACRHFAQGFELSKRRRQQDYRSAGRGNPPPRFPGQKMDVKCRCTAVCGFILLF